MANKFLTSTTEGDITKALGDDAIMSPIPETKGADIILYTPHGVVGWQRKVLPGDFTTSFYDGRLARAIPLLKENCVFQRIIGEGKFSYYPDGKLDMGRLKGGKPINTRLTENHILGMINDIQFVNDIKIDWTKDLQATIKYLRQTRTFLMETKHQGLYKRPSAQGAWVVPSAREIDLWILQSFPGVGPAVADRIMDYFNGEIPLKWTCTFEQLASIGRVTAAIAKIMWESLPSSAPIPVDFDPKQAKRKTAMAETFNLRYGSDLSSLKDRLKR